MKKPAILAAIALGLLATDRLQAANAAAPALPVLIVQSVQTNPVTWFVDAVARQNEAFKKAGGPERYTRIFRGVVAGADTGTLFSVHFAESFADQARLSDAVPRSELPYDPSDPEWSGNSPAVALKAVYYEGDYDGEWIYLTFAHVTDAPAYAKALRDVRTLLDAHDLKDIRVNLYKVALGRSSVTHEVAICAPSKARLAALMDAMSAPWIADWLASLAPMRSIVSNGSYREITK